MSIYFFSNSVSFSLRKGLGPLTLALVTKGIFAIGLVEISAVVLKKKMHIRTVHDDNNMYGSRGGGGGGGPPRSFEK